MLGRSLCSALAVLLFTALAQAQGSPEGHWEGAFLVNNREIGLTLDLAKNPKSEWIASMGMPADNMTGLVVMDVKVNGNSVSFTGVEIRMAKFDLTLNPDGTMKGTMKGAIGAPQESAQVEFKRTGDAKVELISPSPAVSKQFEGDWEGSLQAGGRELRIVFHLKNQPDNTVAATVDTPDSGGVGLPLNNVKQVGKSVEFGMKIAHAKFQGTLNQEGTELVGQFSHEENQMALTLRKK
jgi:hypothetical protein